VRPLEDVRIVAIEQYGAGPFGSLHLADLGAEVIKIEDPRSGGDVGRYIPPFQHGQDSLFFETFNRNKRSLSLDMNVAAGRRVFEDLVRHSDAVCSNLRGDVPERLGIRYEDLKDLNPRIVCCSLSGFGMVGSRRDQPGYDYLLQGMAGWMSLTGEPDGPPAKSGLSLVDFSAGYVAGLALLAGLHAARRDGRGMDCDISLYDVAINLLTYQGTWHLTEGYEPQRMARSAHPSVVPFQNFPTADGWMVVACPKDKFWAHLADAIGRPELAEDERFKEFADRRTNRDELVAILDEIFVTRTTEAWLGILGAARVPCAPVWTVEETLADPGVRERGLIVETEHEHFGRVRSIASPVRVGEQRTDHRRAPRLNEDAEYVLQELLGYPPETVEELAREGVIDASAVPVHRVGLEATRGE
jgi:crotonobetainyl-CoA:carnitine CoA-transferase CaiB-like acyl-CoA transferase